MRLTILLINILLVHSIPDHIIDNKSNTTRLAKWFGFPEGFARFENSFCNGTNGLFGTCYTRRVCTSIAGQSSGRCQTGSLGACCIITRRCGTTSAYNNTYFVNPNFPDVDSKAQTCSITIPPCNSDICQLRIDFLALSLAQPDGEGVCRNDALTIEGGASPLPIICGDNSGQHVYVSYNGLTPITITVLLGDDTVFDRKWTIRIAQIACSCPTLAPIGCLMYYMGETGTVTSFNFGRPVSAGSNGVNGQAGTRELANLNYGVCVEMLPGYCGIEWTQTRNDRYSFTVSGDTIGALPNLPGSPMTGIQCNSDYVIIPNAEDQTSDRFCGNQLRMIKTYSKPFVLTVVTNNEETTDIGNRGFSLMYTQIPCPVNMVTI